MGSNSNLSAWQRELSAWYFANVTTTSRYCGENLSAYGFKYAPGDYIPVDKRYSAMLSHDWAMKCKALHEKQRIKPNAR